MATAIVFQHVANRVTISGELLSAVTANTDGVWVRLDRCHPFTVSIETDGAWVGTVNLHVSDAANRPANNEPGGNLGQDGGYTASTEAKFDAPYVWIKASVTNRSA